VGCSGHDLRHRTHFDRRRGADRGGHEVHRRSGRNSRSLGLEGRHSRRPPLFFAGVFFLALAFFALLFALNHLDLSLVAPASASLTLVTNAVAAKIFLKENVDRRRWTSAVLVCIGVYFLAH
jgi:drug/metabolite transporter (DMT)-like permease